MIFLNYSLGLYVDKFRLNEYNYMQVIFSNYIEVYFMNGYITVEEVANKWGITARQVQILCKENRIVGAARLSRIWIIPENAQKPTKDVRKN